ncbi:MAG: glycosyltransferase family 4 protein [Chloroflexota bacterium]|nr:glycosyltransferase family 4 protein [Chloroflexota bacterium]
MATDAAHDQSGASPYQTGVLVLGRALHAPWNEGIRVINRDFARAASAARAVSTISLTHEDFRQRTDESGAIEHVYTRAGYGLAGIYGGLPGLYRRARRTLATHPIGVAHLFGLSLALAPWFRWRKVRVVSHVMATAVEKKYGILDLVSRRILDRWIDAYAVTSPALLPSLRGHGVPASKIVVLPPAVDTTVYCPGDQAAARQKLGVQPADRIVLYIGKLSPQRFPVQFVRDALLMAGERLGAPMRVFVFGAGAALDGSKYTAEYTQQNSDAVARALQGIPNADIQVVCTNLTAEEKVCWLQAADVMLLPFLAAESVEPPLTLLEAMACGAAPLVTPVANQSALVESGRNGFVCATSQELATALAFVFGARADGTLRAIQAAARATILHRHSMAAVAQAAMRLWDRLEPASAPLRQRPNLYPIE